MPHNCQWSYEELHNARRQAEIEAEAMRKMLREEQKRRDREVQRQAQVSAKSPSVLEEPARRPSEAAEAIYKMQRDDKTRREHARWIFEHRNSIDRRWLEVRYGWENVREAINRTKKSYHCGVQGAIQILCRNFVEEDWMDCRDRLLEMYIRDLKQGKEI